MSLNSYLTAQNKEFEDT